MNKIYYLMNKDKELLEYNKTRGTVKLLIPIEEFNRLNIFTVHEPNFDILGSEFDKWCIDRVSMNRDFISFHYAIFENLHKDCDLFDYLVSSKGLSLHDTLWFKEINDNSSWSDVNLYTNKLNTKLTNLLLFGDYEEDYSLKDFTNSPEVTTYGLRPKAWFNNDNSLYLLKVDYDDCITPNMNSFSEVFSSIIAKYLVINSVEYKLKFHKDKIGAICKAFTDEDIGFLPAKHYFKGLSYKEFIKTDLYKTYEKEIQDMMFLDFLLHNRDRGLDDWGFLIDNSTREIKGFAPLFDFNECLWSYHFNDSLERDSIEDDYHYQYYRNQNNFFKSFEISYLPLLKLDVNNINNLLNLKEALINNTILDSFQNINFIPNGITRYNIIKNLLIHRIDYLLDVFEKR